MVEPQQRDPPSHLWLACRQGAYTVLFLSFILGAVPLGFHHLGEFICPREILRPGTVQKMLGGAVIAAGLAGYLFCSMWLVVVGKGPFVEFDPPTQFVATGPFRWVRNPIASLLILTVLGEAIFFRSPGIFFLALLGLPLAQLQVTRIEEPRLEERFGREYVEYCRRVPRWIPRRPRRDAAASTESGSD